MTTPPRRRPGGRPSKLLEGWDGTTGTWAAGSPVARLLAAVADWDPPTVAAHRAGIGPSSMQAWLAEARRGGESGRPTKATRAAVALAEQVAQAKATAQHEAIAHLKKSASKGSAKAALDYLRSQHPADWPAELRRHEVQMSLLGSEDWNVTRELLMGALGSFPQARAAVVAAIEEAGRRAHQRRTEGPQP